MTNSSTSILERIRRRCAQVSRDARWVRVDAESLQALAGGLCRAEHHPHCPDPGREKLATPDATLAFALTLNALNFGSGWFPHLRKLPGKSGYLTISARVHEWFVSEGPPSARELARMTPARCATLLGQDLRPPVDELMELFARSLSDLGTAVDDRHGGAFEGLVAEASRSADRLVGVMSHMPLYRDVAEVRGIEVPFYKRAQILAADLHSLFDGRGPGEFHDLDSLTCFADNLVPHVLRMRRVLRYKAELIRRIDSGRTLASGSREEVEIRAAAVTAVEGLSSACADRGVRLPPREIDERLWTSGQSPEIKAVPRHRTRCPFY